MLSKERKVEMYRQMLRIRYFELKVKELFSKGEISGSTHVYLGEEAIAVGACSVLNKEDYITSTHRGHGHCLAKGGDLNLMMAEIMSKATGYCNGKGGSMHIADLDIGILGANGIVGGGFPISVGAGLSSVYKDNKRVTVCFFGDGASNQGSFHEAVNMASVLKLPVIFICENNGFAVTTSIKKSSNIEDLYLRAAGYGIDGYKIDGNDVLEVYNTVEKAVKNARNGGGPSFIECKTYRWDGHYLGDPELYRTRDEVASWKVREPIKRFRSVLTTEGIITEVEADEIEAEVVERVKQAERFAKESPNPRPEEAYLNIFAPEYSVEEKSLSTTRMKKITYRQAINEALDEEMRRDADVLVLGEDVGEFGGAFQITKELWQKHGDKRALSTPLSEAAIAGAGVGSAVTGLRPVVEIMYIDFMTIAMDQVVNQAAKMRYMFGGKAKLPMVFRTQCGLGKGGAAQHSQSLEAWFMHVPGLKVVIPSTPYDVKGLLKTAIRDDNPVVFIEYKDLYAAEGEVPEEEYLIPLGKAAVRRTGNDVTIVATSRMVSKALKAAEILENEGISAEVIDPRTLVPLDMDTIINSVMKTHKAVICHDAWKTCGIGAELTAQIMEKAFVYLDAPVVRVAAKDTPMPFNTVLEQEVLPQIDDIVYAVKSSYTYEFR